MPIVLSGMPQDGSPDFTDLLTARIDESRIVCKPCPDSLESVDKDEACDCSASIVGTCESL